MKKPCDLAQISGETSRGFLAPDILLGDSYRQSTYKQLERNTHRLTH